MLRQIVCTLVFAGMFAFHPTSVQAQDIDKPTAKERAELERCLKMKNRSGESEEACVFSIAAVCMEKPENGSTLGQREQSAKLGDDVNR